MKKYLIFVMGIVIGIVGTSYAAYKLKAEQVSFDKTNTNLNSENVQTVIDELATNISNLKIDNINIASVESIRGYTFVSRGNDSVEFTTTKNKIVATIKKPCKGFIVTDFYYGGNAIYRRIVLNGKVIYNHTDKDNAYTINNLDIGLKIGDQITVEIIGHYGSDTGQYMLTLIII